MVAQRRRASVRTAKSCGPDISTLISSWRQSLRIALATVTKTPDHRLFDSHILKPQSGPVFDAAEGFEA
jgi:hypothetical protein